MDAVTFDVSPDHAEKIEKETEAKDVRVAVKVTNGKLAVSTGLRAGGAEGKGGVETAPKGPIFVAVNAPFKSALLA
jgi:hypothetical protein